MARTVTLLTFLVYRLTSIGSVRGATVQAPRSILVLICHEAAACRNPQARTIEAYRAEIGKLRAQISRGT